MPQEWREACIDLSRESKVWEAGSPVAPRATTNSEDVSSSFYPTFLVEIKVCSDFLSLDQYAPNSHLSRTLYQLVSMYWVCMILIDNCFGLFKVSVLITSLCNVLFESSHVYA